MLELGEFVKLQKVINDYVHLDGGTHVFRIAKYTSILLAAMGKSNEYSGYVGLGAALHDIGKIFIPLEILEKPGKLTPGEFEIVKTHSLEGYKLMAGLKSNFFQMSAEISLYHHENYDGTGYPMGIKGQQIPFNARVVSIVDVFDSLVHKRSYKDNWSIKEALDFMNEQTGKKFDPELMEHFDKVVSKLAGQVELATHLDLLANQPTG